MDFVGQISVFIGKMTDINEISVILQRSKEGENHAKVIYGVRSSVSQALCFQ